MNMKLKKIMGLLLVVILLSMSSTFANGEEKFKDMPNDWSESAMENAIKNGILSGYDGMIYPNKNLTRAELASIMNRVMGAKNKVDISIYTDVKTTDWFFEEIQKSVGMEILTGNAGKMRPKDFVTREEAFVVISNAFNIKSDNLLKTFKDTNKLSTWARESTFGLVNSGYIMGDKDKLNPKQNITRAEFAGLIYNIVKNYVNKPLTYETFVPGNVIVNVPGATLKNIVIKGDLIIADGVGEGEVTLDNVKVEGKLLVRAGGENSIVITGNSNIKSIVIVKDGNIVRIYNESGLEIASTIIEGDADVILEGDFDNVTVTSPGITIQTRNGEIASLIVEAPNTSISVSSGSTIDEIEIDSANTEVSGLGMVKLVTVGENGDNSEITTLSTKIDVDSNASNITGTNNLVLTSDKIYTNGSTQTQNPILITPPVVQPTTETTTEDDDDNTPVTIYHKVNYIVTGVGGTITADFTTGSNIVHNTQKTFTLVPAIGYKVKSVTVNTLPKEILNNSFTITVAAETNIVVEFELIKYSLNFTLNPSDLSLEVFNAQDELVTIPNDKLLIPGTYSYVAQKEGYYPDEAEFVLDANKTIDIELEQFPILTEIIAPMSLKFDLGEDLIGLPETVTVLVNNDEEVVLDVSWDIPVITEAGTYEINGEFVDLGEIQNPEELFPMIEVDVVGAPEVTVNVVEGELLLTFNQEPFINSEPISSYSTLDVMAQLFNDEMVYELYNPDAVEMSYDNLVLTLRFLDNAVGQDYLMFYDEDENGVHREVLNLDLSIFTTENGLISESTTDSINTKFSVPMENGIPNYEANIIGEFQNFAQASSDVDPEKDTTSPVLVSLNPLLEGTLEFEQDETFKVWLEASDENLYKVLININDYTFELLANEYPYVSSESEAELLSDGITASYADGLWMIDAGQGFTDFADATSEQVFFAFDIYDYAENSYSEGMGMEPMWFYIQYLDRSDLDYFKSEVEFLNRELYTISSLMVVDDALLLPESTQFEIDEKTLAISDALLNLEELIFPSSIIISDDYTTVTIDETYQFYAEVLPIDTHFPEILWSVVSGNGEITTDGLLTVTGEGLITVRAESVFDSLVYSEYSVISSNSNTLPVANDDFIYVDLNGSAGVDVLFNDVDIDDDMLFVDSFTQGENGTVTQGNGVLIYTPNEDFVGEDFFLYYLNDGTDYVEGIARIEVITSVPEKIASYTILSDSVTVQVFDYDGVVKMISTDSGYLTTIGVGANRINVDAGQSIVYVMMIIDGNLEIIGIEDENAITYSNSISSLDIGGIGVLDFYDYTIDETDNIHIIFFDHYATSELYPQDDLMYFNNITNTSEIIHTGYREHLGGSNYVNSYVSEVMPAIGNDHNGNVVILFAYRDWSSWSGGQDHSYYLNVADPINDIMTNLESYYLSSTGMRFENLDVISGYGNLTIQYVYESVFYSEILENGLMPE